MFVDIDKQILKCIWKNKDTCFRIAETIWGRKNKV